MRYALWSLRCARGPSCPSRRDRDDEPHRVANVGRRASEDEKHPDRRPYHVPASDIRRRNASPS